jgi:hypothetical protein
LISQIKENTIVKIMPQASFKCAGSILNQPRSALIGAKNGIIPTNNIINFGNKD